MNTTSDSTPSVAIVRAIGTALLPPPRPTSGATAAPMVTVHRATRPRHRRQGQGARDVASPARHSMVCPSTSPSKQALNVSWTCDALAPKSLLSRGRPSRYISTDNGPKVVNAPRMMTRPIPVGASQTGVVFGVARFAVVRDGFITSAGHRRWACPTTFPGVRVSPATRGRACGTTRYRGCGF